MLVVVFIEFIVFVEFDQSVKSVSVSLSGSTSAATFDLDSDLDTDSEVICSYPLYAIHRAKQNTQYANHTTLNGSLPPPFLPSFLSFDVGWSSPD